MLILCGRGGGGVGVFFCWLGVHETKRNETFYSTRKAPRQDAMKGKSPRLQNKIKWQTERTKQTKWMCQQQRDTATRMKKSGSFNFALDYSRERDLIYLIFGCPIFFCHYIYFVLFFLFPSLILLLSYIVCIAIRWIIWALIWLLA